MSTRSKPLRKERELLKQIQFEQSEIARLKEELAEHKSKLMIYEKKLFQKEGVDVFERCISIIKDRPSLFRGWRSRKAGNRLAVVYYIYHVAKEEKKSMFELLDGVYTFVKEDRTNVPNFEDSKAIMKYLRRDEYGITDEMKIRKLPVDTQILLITKRAYEILEEYGSFRSFAKSVCRDQAYYGPN